jgi:hypothetical protein
VLPSVLLELQHRQHQRLVVGDRQGGPGGGEVRMYQRSAGPWGVNGFLNAGDFGVTADLAAPRDGFPSPRSFSPVSLGAATQPGGEPAPSSLSSPQL